MNVIVTLLISFTPLTLAQDKTEYIPSIYGMQSITVYSDTDDKLNVIKSFVGQRGFEFLRISKLRQISVEVLITQDRVNDFKSALQANSIFYNVTIDDISKVIHKNSELQKRKRVRRAPRNSINFGQFATYAQITSYVDYLVRNYENIVEVLTIGKSYRDVDIVAVKISIGGDNKPALLIDAGIHGREWISVSSALYIMKQLIENPENLHLLQTIDVYIIPCVNPDGYMFTHRSEESRLWRKTRSRNRFSWCRGTDINRNFDIFWGFGEASTDPCSDIYIGREAFSEKESIAFRTFILPLQNKITTYVSLHSYAGLILYPWSFTNVQPINIRKLNCVARRVQSAITRVAGTFYNIGNSHDLLYATAGNSMDWVAAHTNINLSFTIEIAAGDYGFIPGAEHIIPTAIEIFEAIKIFAQATDGRICNRM